MHLYWRVIEELKFIGETWIFNDPSLARNFKHWVKKNADAINMMNRAETCPDSPIFALNGFPHSLN